MKHADNAIKKVPQYSAIGDAILIRLLSRDSETVTDSGIRLPDTMKEEEHFGTVHDIGPDCEVTGIKKGDKVVFSPHQPTGWQNNAGARFLKMRAQDIWSVVTYVDKANISLS